MTRRGLQHPDALENWLVARTTVAQGAGELPAGVLAGQRSDEGALAILHAQLDRLFGHGGAHGAPVTSGNTGP